eukprot:SAG25_NODE_1404_length_3105_cov_2.112442_4_plen_71_part_00
MLVHGFSTCNLETERTSSTVCAARRFIMTIVNLLSTLLTVPLCEAPSRHDRRPYAAPFGGIALAPGAAIP